MGQPKLLLPLGEKTVLEHVAAAVCAGESSIYSVVVAPQAQCWLNGSRGGAARAATHGRDSRHGRRLVKKDLPGWSDIGNRRRKTAGCSCQPIIPPCAAR